MNKFQILKDNKDSELIRIDSIQSIMLNKWKSIKEQKNLIDD